MLELDRLKAIYEITPNCYTKEKYLNELHQNELMHLMSALDIEDEFERDIIDFFERLIKHEENDLKYGLKFIS